MYIFWIILQIINLSTFIRQSIDFGLISNYNTHSKLTDETISLGSAHRIRHLLCFFRCPATFESGVKHLNNPVKFFFDKHAIVLDQIRYILREEKKTSVYLLDGRMVTTYITMKDILDYLPESQFLRVNKSYILPISQIASVKDGIYVTKDGRTFAGRVRDKSSHSKVAKALQSAEATKPTAADIQPLSPVEWNGFWQTMKQSSQDALMSTYFRILKVDLTRDTYITIKDDYEPTAPSLCPTLSAWLQNFVISGRIHQEDIADFQNCSQLDFLRDFFWRHPSGTPYCLQYRRRTDNDYRWAIMEIVPAEDYSALHQMVYLFVKDIQDTINDSELLLATVLRSLSDSFESIYCIDFTQNKVIAHRSHPRMGMDFSRMAHTGLTYQSAVQSWIEGFPKELSRELSSFFKPEYLKSRLEAEDSFSYEFKVPGIEESAYQRITCSKLVKGQKTDKVVIAFTDVTKDIRLADYEHDALTGLHEKNAFYRYAAQEVHAHPEDAYDILCSDIDNFKFANEQLGVEACDELLRRISSELMSGLPGCVMGGRLGGDVFAFLLKNASSQALQAVIPRLLSGDLRSHFIVRYGLVHIDDSICIQGHCDHARMVISDIKGSYRQRFAEYDVRFHNQALMNLKLTQNAEKALEEQQFAVHYQPKLDLSTGKMAGAEALVRWVHPEMGTVPNANFIPLYERSGFIFLLDKYVLTRICSELSDWIAKKLPLVPISVNLSRMDFKDEDMAEQIRKIVDSFGIPHSLLHFEITETAYASNSSVITRHVKELAEMGFQIELDDFGTGYSSMLTLATLELRYLKLDKSLIDKMFTENGKKILRSAISLAKTLNLKLIAEGIETQEQLEVLTEMQCDYIQGFHYAVPLSPEEYIEFLVQNV